MLRRHLGHVLGKIDEHCARLFGLCDLEGFANDFGHDLRREDLRRVLRDRPKHVDQVENLMTLLVQPGCCALPRDRDHGSPIHVGVRHASDQIRRARPERRHANTGTTGEPAVHVGHESCTLLVMRRHKADRTVQQCVHHIDVLFARNAEDELDLLVLEALDQELCCFHVYLQ